MIIDIKDFCRQLILLCGQNLKPKESLTFKMGLDMLVDKTILVVEQTCRQFYEGCRQRGEGLFR